ncbi:beta-glucosidase [Ktedonobacteria bacterium brp13]|nr:beta-glucosidase [Ktedonobacteria bacterium brp13]
MNEATIEELIQSMTPEEKVSMLDGMDNWHTQPIECLGIPSLKVSDGPNGARGNGDVPYATRANCFPAGIALAATWDTALVERVGIALAQDTKSKSAHVLLAPTVNIHRSTLNGRNFESYSEDPYLSARLAVAYINGVQSQGVGTSVKHFVCNDSEFERFTMNSEVSERALREIYLPAFDAAIREAKSWTIMAAYNLVNGIAASEHPYLLTEILRDEWNYDGVVVSDWFASVKSTAPSLNAGLDLEMPGPGAWRGEKLLQAFHNGEVSEETLDRSVRRLLHLINKAGLFEQPGDDSEFYNDSPEVYALIREAAADGFVLLKNEQETLPLQQEQLSKIAVIGPNARDARIMAGGSARVNIDYAVSPLEGIVNAVGSKAEVNFEYGCLNYKVLPLCDTSQLQAGTERTEQGFEVSYFNNLELAGEPIVSQIKYTPDLHWYPYEHSLPAGLDVNTFSIRATARLTPTTSGNYDFGLGSNSQSRLYIDGALFIDNWQAQKPSELPEIKLDLDLSFGFTEHIKPFELQAGRTYTITIEYSASSAVVYNRVRLGIMPHVPADTFERALQLARTSDIAIVCAGLSDEWESEGFDRPTMDLPAEQVELIQRVAAANPRTIVVLNTGAPISMPWLDQVAAVIQSWYPGQECGNAVADVLFGKVTPSGKLPQTFPVRLEDNPAYINYPGENGKVTYGEGIFVGYRYYDKKKIAPLFPFGFGLSYTTFAYGPVTLSAEQIAGDEALTVSVDVKNTGNYKGKETVQLYIHDRKARLVRPEKELKGFTKVELAPGESKTVTLTLQREALGYFDDSVHSWIAEPGEFEVLIGSSSQDIRGTATFTLTTEARWL